MEWARQAPGRRGQSAMHGTNRERWQHDHDDLGDSHEQNERQTRLLIALTAVMMVV